MSTTRRCECGSVQGAGRGSAYASLGVAAQAPTGQCKSRQEVPLSLYRTARSAFLAFERCRSLPWWIAGKPDHSTGISGSLRLLFSWARFGVAVALRPRDCCGRRRRVTKPGRPRAGGLRRAPDPSGTWCGCRGTPSGGYGTAPPLRYGFWPRAAPCRIPVGAEGEERGGRGNDDAGRFAGGASGIRRDGGELSNACGQVGRGSSRMTCLRE